MTLPREPIGAASGERAMGRGGGILPSICRIARSIFSSAASTLVMGKTSPLAFMATRVTLFLLLFEMDGEALQGDLGEEWLPT